MAPMKKIIKVSKLHQFNNLLTILFMIAEV